MSCLQRCIDIGICVTRRHQLKIRFLLTGALNTIIGLAVYPSLYFLLAPIRLHYLTILVMSHVICVTFAFLTNKFLVFKTFGNYLKESTKFFLFHLIIFILNLGILPSLVEFAGMNPVWGQTFFATLVIVSSYFWYSRIAFSSSKMTQ